MNSVWKDIFSHVFSDTFANVCIDKLIDIVNKYNNTYHSTIKMKPADVTSRRNIDFCMENKGKMAKMVIMKEYWDTKTFLQKVMLRIDLKKIL